MGRFPFSKKFLKFQLGCLEHTFSGRSTGKFPGMIEILKRQSCFPVGKFPVIKHVSFTSFHNESPAVPGYSHTAISVPHLPKALRSHGHLPSLRLGIWQPATCNKIVSGHKQFNVASAISNFKKILSKNISPFGTVKTESENIWIC